MRKVHIFTVQRPVGNKTSVRVLSDAFGLNIPHYLPLEGGDYNGPQYLFCVDRTVDFESICEKYNYRYFNREQPYRLDKYQPSGYDSD